MARLFRTQPKILTNVERCTRISISHIEIYSCAQRFIKISLRWIHIESRGKAPPFAIVEKSVIPQMIVSVPEGASQ